MGLCWPLLAIIGCCGPSLTCVGLRWPLLAAVGFCRPALAAVGFCGPALAAVGFRGPALAFGGRRWLLWAFVVNKMEEKIEKKTDLGPKRRQTRRLGPFSSSWAFVGRHWLLNGYCGPSLTCIGRRWPSLALWAFMGLRWPSLAAVGLRGPALALVGCCGPSLTYVGRRWPSLALWAFVGRSNNNKIKILYIKKKTYLIWPKRRRLASFGPFFSLPSIQTLFDDLMHE